MQKIPMNKICILFMFSCVICMNISAQENNQYENTQTLGERLQELILIISNNLEGTTVYDQFIKEQELWEKYKDAHIETLFPDYIDGVEMLWGSILGYAIGQEKERMIIDRIRVLESFLNDHRGTGTDGKGEFKEAVEEIRLIFPYRQRKSDG